ncbi:MAG: hypothetical protein K2H14_01775, partial [Muribaculaceae bacterium]|nr:hypothetical protein [Muribaculaceae bacterium]
MKIQSFYSRFSLLAVSLLAGASAAIAQGYYDDDIYYDASKAKKEVKKAVEKAKAEEPAFRQQQASQFYYDGAAYVPWNNVGEYNSADSYQVSGTSMRDVDEYNRRTSSVSPVQEKTDSITLEQFEEMSNTRNLARFHDSEAAREAYAETLDEGGIRADDSDIYAYSAQPATVNINVIGGGYPYYGYYN